MSALCEAQTIARGEILDTRAVARSVPLGRPPNSGKTVDAPRKLEIGTGEPALGVRRDLQANPVPAVQEDVGMMVGGLGSVGNPVDERDRMGKVGELPLAHDRLALARPLAASEPSVDLRVGEERHAS
jgi:hypothetical protein